MNLGVLVCLFVSRVHVRHILASWLLHRSTVWPQGLYRLAEMIEEGFRFAVGNSTLSNLQVPASVAGNNVTLVLHLYSR